MEYKKPSCGDELQRGILAPLWMEPFGVLSHEVHPYQGYLLLDCSLFSLVMGPLHEFDCDEESLLASLYQEVGGKNMHWVKIQKNKK